jgi:hypothetical protein
VNPRTALDFFAFPGYKVGGHSLPYTALSRLSEQQEHAPPFAVDSSPLYRRGWRGKLAEWTDDAVFVLEENIFRGRSPIGRRGPKAM